MLRSLLTAALLLSAPGARAFEEAGSADSRLAEMGRLLETGSWTERIHAVHELEYMHDRAVPTLAKGLDDGDWQVRLTAVQALSPRNVEAAAAMKRLLKYETCPVVRLMTLHALGVNGPNAEEQLKAMRWMSYATPQEVNVCRDQAAPGRAAWVRGGTARPEAPAPAAARPASAPPSRARPEEPEPESAAAEGEEDVLITPDPVIPKPAVAAARPRRPIEDLPEPTKFQRRIELDAILDEPPSPPEREKAPSSSVIARASGTPESLGRPFSLPARAEPAAAEGAVVADAGTGKEEKDPVPTLLAALKKGEARARARAADELGRRGAASEPAVPALMGALRDKSPLVRSSAGLALGNIGAAREGVVPLLIKALRDRSEDVRYAAALGLSRIETPEAQAAFRAHVSAEARATIERSKVKSR